MREMGPAVVFLGPSLPVDEARAILPQGRFLPPAKRGSLKLLADQRPAAIGIIDGEFYQSFAISPIEILPFLDQGIAVFGGSSMGALRAVELEPEGMRGVGRIFEMFRSGELDADDEVAVTFDPSTLRPLSEPLVNLRIALGRAVAAGLLTAGQSQAVIRDLKELYFPYRTVPALYAAAARCATRPTLEALKAWWPVHAPDTKAEDARQLLAAMGQASAGRRTC
jgi:TfuA protein